ncbi:unannotated protein [freshwater metagenome]|uniref:Unannotated protein n=1 Tax=freshwater metagenome TaxID=449393 RepID=A0A6J6N0G9_9ZZZZ
MRSESSEFTVPANTGEPASFSTRAASPVSMDSLTLAEPEITIPSIAITDPGLTTIWSPALILKTGMVTYFSPLRTSAVSGSMLCNAPKAFDALITADISIQ